MARYLSSVVAILMLAALAGGCRDFFAFQPFRCCRGAGDLFSCATARGIMRCSQPRHKMHFSPSRRRRLRACSLPSLRSCDDQPGQDAPLPWKPKLRKPTLVLLGSPGSGRRSLGRSLARRLNVTFVDALEMSAEAEVDMLDSMCKSTSIENQSLQARGLAAVVASSALTANPSTCPVLRALERAKDGGHLVVHIQRFKEYDDHQVSLDQFNQATSSHRFGALDCAALASGVGAGPNDKGEQWKTLRSIELAVDDLHAMVHRLIYSPPILLLGSTVEPLASPTSSAPTLGRTGSDIVELSIDRWREECRLESAHSVNTMSAALNSNALPRDRLGLESMLLRSFAMTRRKFDSPFLWALRSVGQG